MMPARIRKNAAVLRRIFFRSIDSNKSCGQRTCKRPESIKTKSIWEPDNANTKAAGPYDRAQMLKRDPRLSITLIPKSAARKCLCRVCISFFHARRKRGNKNSRRHHMIIARLIHRKAEPKGTRLVTWRKIIA